jgi:hypothetical protein
VCFSSRQNLTFLGAGVAATHLVGANNNGCNNSFDAFAVVASQNIVLRNLHVASPSNRSIVVQGIVGGTSSATLDRVSTAGSRTHGVLAAGVPGTPSTLVVESSNIDQSQIGNGVFLGGGVNATIRRSTIDDNGTAAPATDGHGLVSFLDSTLLFELGSSSFNYRTALLFDHTSVAVIRNNTFTFNGHGAVFFQKSTSGNVHNNVMDMNGILGTPGCCTGFNAVEVFGDYNGPQMLIHDNSISRSTTNGVFVASGTASVTNNVLFHNFLGVTVHGATSVNVQIHGNRFELPLAQGNEEGLLVEGSAAVVTVGGAGALQNTFVNYIDNPAIHCNPGVTATCPSGGNVFVNSNLPIIGCPASCQQ